MKKKKNKANKRRPNDTLPKNERLTKARKWLKKFEGNKKNMIKRYRKAFHVSVYQAISDLQTIGVKFEEKYLKAVIASEDARIRNKQLKKKARQEEFLDDDDFDEYFAYIAGYTNGGAPFGITWDELGLEPFASDEELKKAYEKYDSQVVTDPDNELYDFDFDEYLDEIEEDTDAEVKEFNFNPDDLPFY